MNDVECVDQCDAMYEILHTKKTKIFIRFSLTYALAGHNGIVRLIRFPVTHVIPGHNPNVVRRSFFQIRHLYAQVFRGADLNNIENRVFFFFLKIICLSINKFIKSPTKPYLSPRFFIDFFDFHAIVFDGYAAVVEWRRPGDR